MNHLRMLKNRSLVRSFFTKYALTCNFFWNTGRKALIAVSLLFVLFSLFPSILFAEDYPIIEFKTLPASITTNISAFPVTGRIPPDTNAVYVDDEPIDFDEDGFFAVTDMNDGNNIITLRFVDQNGVTIEEYSKQILVDPNYLTKDMELIYANVEKAGNNVIVIDVRTSSFLGVIKDKRINGIRRDGSEIIMSYGERYSTGTHTLIGTLPSYSGSGIVFSHDNKYVYYSDKKVDLDSNDIVGILPESIGWPCDITPDDKGIISCEGYIDLNEPNFILREYCGGTLSSLGDLAIDPAGNYVLISSFGSANGQLLICNAEDANEVERHPWHDECDYAGDIVFSPDRQKAYAGFGGNPLYGGGGIIIVDMNTLGYNKFSFRGPRSLAVSKHGKIYAFARIDDDWKYRVGIVELIPTFSSLIISKFYCATNQYYHVLGRVVFTSGSNSIFYKPGQIIFADCNAVGSNDGSSWEDAYNYLQDALADANSAAYCTEIRVANGTYYPDANTTNPNGSGDRQAAFQLINSVTLKGGYGGYGESDPDIRNTQIYETVLSGDINEPDVDTDNSYHVFYNYSYIGPSLDSSAVLDGFTITQGRAYGPGVQGSGGGMYNYNSSPSITNCTFSNNSANYYGGGIDNYNSDPTVTNCTFSGNSATSGGGMYNLSYSSPTVTNCILWGDSPDEIYNNGSSTTTISYSNVEGGWSGTGNIDADPCFADPNNEDYHLKSQAGRWDPNSQTWVQDNVTSPCIDAGNPGCPLADEPNDPNNIRINMGAYGGTAEASRALAGWSLLADLTNDGKVNSNDLGEFVDNWLDSGQCIPSDLNRDKFTDMIDLALFARDWLLETSWYAP